ncbi:murein biosynthesis integral membrane protein MurJ [Spongiactinospora sp. TRM90649]|uniref:murein biosynthesis integral membrane protein MurJ n=1 Tax=Spongiactinospora sp. TRM90649 TaxID=3031114 RepID=UPI0023F93E3D|nr:murein biosynthesis integral membrane protein MurJ [Spongiactinospora sp. TRM90649]MDF5756151.1 murein biosynthesis integral membrane protein MurJ [Spongiactinospora sp. TRM90649]
MSRVLRAGAIMAAGTMVSRVTGFLRTAVLAAAIGTAALGDAYNVAYTIPLILFDLLIGGVLSSVIVPMIVRAKMRDPDGGVAYEQRLMTLAILALGVVAVGAVVLAPQIVDLYTDDWTGAKRDVAISLARFILPQIAFFGVGALAGAILNTRDRFAAPMWAPVLNNLVMIAVGLLYLVVSDAGSSAEAVTPSDLALLGLGTTAGIVVQSVALVISLHRAGFRFRPRFGLRGVGLGEMARTAAWTFAYVGITQFGFWVTTKLATGAGDRVPGAGNAAYSYAWQLFQLPYGVIAVSVITAMLPRMSRSVADGQFGQVREEFASGVRLVCSVIIPAGLLLMVLGPAVTVLIFGHGNMTIDDAVYIGNVLQVFGLALVPFSIFQLLLRVFYSFGDTRTPAFVAAGNVAVNALLSLVAYLVLPDRYIVMGLASSFTIAYVLGTGVAWVLASRRVGGLDGRRVAGALTRMYVVSLPAAALALAVLWGGQSWAGLTALSSLVILAAGGGLGMLLYLAVAHRARIPEVGSIVGLVAGRVGR